MEHHPVDGSKIFVGSRWHKPSDKSSFRIVSISLDPVTMTDVVVWAVYGKYGWCYHGETIDLFKHAISIGLYIYGRVDNRSK